MPERVGIARVGIPRRVKSAGRGATAPFVARAADGVGRWVTRVLGGATATGRAELRDLVAANARLDGEERRIIDEVLAAAARHVREVMVPRTAVVFLPAQLTLLEAGTVVRAARHS